MSERQQVDSDISALLEAWESPTVPPPFDLETFARDRTGMDHERQVPSDRPTEPAPEDPSESTTRLRAHQPTTLAHMGTHELRSQLADEFFDAHYLLALALAEELIARRADDSSAADYADECRRMLEKEYLHRVGGSIVRVPVLAVSAKELPKRKLDHRAGFLLSRIDGESSIEVLLDIGAMPRLEALRLMAELVEAGVLRLRDPH
jgi:hypothetical protein